MSLGEEDKLIEPSFVKEEGLRRRSKKRGLRSITQDRVRIGGRIGLREILRELGLCCSPFFVNICINTHR
jgi:hypothetical protein